MPVWGESGSEMTGLFWRGVDAGLNRGGEVEVRDRVFGVHW